MNSNPITIVWYKRDLRLSDHRPAVEAIASGSPILLLFIWDTELESHPDTSERHWQFQWESICEMNVALERFGGKIHVIRGKADDVFARLLTNFKIREVHSYCETGVTVTYQRDRRLAKWFENNDILWKEHQNNGVIRGAKNRADWDQKWKAHMSAPCEDPNWERAVFYNLSSVENYVPKFESQEHNHQKGGPQKAWQYLNSFIENRHKNYSAHISKPLESRRSCSRLSPYLAWGNLSVRQVYRATAIKYSNKKNARRDLSNFISRIHWHCHFIQKFEMEVRMESENINRGYNSIRNEINHEFLKTWETGNTGYPMVDAAMRCVMATGYINFRLRAMLVSFLTHHLWQPWQSGVHHLARQFLDYEPGIHYPQFQMQASTTGINTIRIYNPTKLALDHDSEAVFIKTWLPELQNLPNHLAIEPWVITPMEELMYTFKYGVDYPMRIVDIQKTGKHAREKLWEIKSEKTVIREASRIVRKHTTAQRSITRRTNQVKPDTKS